MGLINKVFTILSLKTDDDFKSESISKIPNNQLKASLGFCRRVSSGAATGIGLNGAASMYLVLPAFALPVNAIQLGVSTVNKSRIHSEIQSRIARTPGLKDYFHSQGRFARDYIVGATVKTLFFATTFGVLNLADLIDGDNPTSSACADLVQAKIEAEPGLEVLDKGMTEFTQAIGNQVAEQLSGLTGFEMTDKMTWDDFLILLGEENTEPGVAKELWLQASATGICYELSQPTTIAGEWYIHWVILKRDMQKDRTVHKEEDS